MKSFKEQAQITRTIPTESLIVDRDKIANLLDKAADMLAELERVAKAWDDADGGNADESFVYNLGDDFRERLRALLARVKGVG